MQYFLLGAYTGLALDIVGVLRDVVFYNKDKKWASSNWWTVFWAAAMIVVGIFMYQNWMSLFMMAAMALNTVLFSFTKPKLVYNILTGSIGGVINELFTEISSVVGIIRYDIKKKDKTA